MQNELPKILKTTIMKKILLFTITSFLFISCGQKSSLEPDALGVELFDIFKSDNVEGIKNITITIQERLDNYDLGSDEISKMSDEQQKELNKLKSDKEYQKEFDDKVYKKVAKDFIRAREELVKKTNANISTYNISNTYAEIETIQGKRAGRIIIEVENDANDKQLIGFEVLELSEDNWKLYDDIWIANSIGDDFIKYKYIDILNK
jgi:hypothetical protein